MIRIRSVALISTLFCAFCLTACDKTAWNNPHKAKDSLANYGYSSFSEPPKTLDPVKSYSSDEIVFSAQIYEPLLQYDYFSRPYKLVPLTATEMPVAIYKDTNDNVLPVNAPIKDIAYTVYDIHIKPGILYQPHPAFAKDSTGQYLYHNVKADDFSHVKILSDFKKTGTRELTVDDYIYEIKRIADPNSGSPIYGVMNKYIVDLESLHQRLKDARESGIKFLDLREFDLKGVKKMDDYHFQIIVKGRYPQFTYWLAMTFFAPIPWEADVFYSQPHMNELNLNFSWYPVGTGPYLLEENNPNRQMVLARNPNFHGELFPGGASEDDQTQGYAADVGKSVPLLDKVIYGLEKESIPRWSKFLQGYYDNSAISSDSFDQAIQVDRNGNVDLTSELKEKKVRLETVVSPSIFYYGFNMLDPVVGGNSDRARKLRQAISIAVDYQEYISIFMNGRGLVAQGPIPPGIFGYSDEKNPIANMPINTAKKLLAEAGYPDGVDEKTGEPLVLHYDITSSAGPDDKARFDWMRKQFAKIGVQLNIRSTQYSRFQEKMRTGNAQIFGWGWNADYPDPENFLFLLYGPNGKVKHGGENAANYSNPVFDQLFEQMKNLDNTPKRKEIIDKMVKIAQVDSPWIWGVYPKNFVLSHQWVRPSKPSSMANNYLKYAHYYPNKRAIKRKDWNQPITWPLYVLLLLLAVIFIPVIASYMRRQRRSIK